MREKIIEILMDINPDNDYDTEKNLMMDELLDSFDIVNLVGELNDVFDVKITVVDVTEENFASVESIESLVRRAEVR